MSDDDNITSNKNEKGSTDTPVAEIPFSVEFRGENFYSFGIDLFGLGKCAGMPDNTSCGAGCICIDQQPHYTLDQFRAMGIKIK